MAKELPYFKFEPNAWESGMIQLCSLESKGLFIELCCLYWSRLGDLPYALALQKLCMGNTSLLQELEKNQIYEVQDNQIVIGFLDSQLEEFQDTSEKRRNAANKRWSNASALQEESKSNAIREEKRKEEKSIEERKRDFYKSLVPHLEKYGEDMIREFYNHWSEHSPKQRKFRMEKETAFDISKRLATWKSRSEKWNTPKNGNQTTATPYHNR